ncbi:MULTISPECIES: molybdenum cofactor biosynthesis protein MoaE [unclassified Paracoccus (in: a-proteobacteria)]|uniref:molybdenum cofactor biosynthesis protein MoaE n=1 Tax=unclassified Paracoccus (in: a-proteobacteria) TaxID=2688777 RepID=UPI001603A444|nr:MULTISPECIES: molybdenum cofactor biosynthesis protein MoaE [unclassified Paracoccus (in: a-proteobacteria)]MBB1490304.1 molybdenum cofactor biosynthesis protein MoaE [Paracoccus sp. MC1854]MBB1498762.1 molybdenum cofactor biosynthesis protein MoaE [Paracoccus sp. MC1862]QQO43922.1 molybdenum cofactor biosynthesis protein MoaE [Paracoccus sp. MC1862]
MRVLLQAEPFDAAALTDGFGAGAGAVVTFTGLVRADNGLTALEIEHYPGMTERALSDHAQAAADRFALTDVLVVHRHGRIHIGEPIMMVATAAPHRRAAFDAADFLMDWLKSRAPFWKREIGPDGSRGWVAAKDEDEAALDRWQV